MIVQPQSPPQLKPNLRTWCAAEWNHLTDMSIQTFVLLAVPTIIVFWFNPFLPLGASALQLWAGQSWQWLSFVRVIASFARIRATLPGGFSRLRLPHNVAKHHSPASLR